MDTTFTVTGPESIIAAIPHLLGFEPEHSIIAIWVRDRQVSLTQRLDLPDPDTSLTDVAAVVFGTSVHAHADSVVFVTVADRGGPEAELPCRDLVDHLIDAAALADIQVLDALHWSEGRFWSHLCTDGCCPPGGRIVGRAAQIEADSSFGGSRPKGRRRDLVGAWEPDAGARDRIEPLVIDLEGDLDSALRGARQTRLEAWRDEQITIVEEWLTSNVELDDASVARLLIACCDVRVRDTVVWTIAQRDEIAWATTWFGTALRCAPDGYVAPIASMLALACWQQGDGARALIALDRALADDPEYSMAVLLLQSISTGLPPADWLQLMRSMSREQCRVPTT